MKHRAKKSLGQNFLKSEKILDQIVNAGEVGGGDTVLEIGPGKGALTEKILEKAGNVIAVEKDDTLFEILQEKFSAQIASGSLVLVHDDILDFDPKAYRLKPSAFKIIANIPYNITGAILKKFLTVKNQPELMVLMMQQEVAQRILARDGKESILSISVKAYGEPKMVMKAPRRYFSPAPKVDSAVIAIQNISKLFFIQNDIDENKFWQIVKTGFAHKRKKLASNLKPLLGKASQLQLETLENKRAEDLSLSDWLTLTRML